MKSPRQPTVQLINLGCAKNVVDSEEILGCLHRDGFAIRGSGRRADVVVVNTCGFLESAREESLSVIREAARRKRRGEIKRLVVAGCLAQRARDELAAIPGVDAVIGPGQNERVAAIAAGSAERQLVEVAERPVHQWSPVPVRMLSTPPWSAYLKISEGCDHPCAFCTIPSIRGPHTSKPFDAVLREAEDLAAAGVKEFNLVAQDTTRYGQDLPGHPDLSELLRALSEVDGIRWIRVFYAYPSAQVYRLAETMAELPRVCRYLDMPLQHSDGTLLRRMRRPGDGERYLRMIEQIRETAPGIALRTTFIVGLPGETEEAFEGLLRFVEQARFDRVGVFEFSPETGTDAATMEDQVEPTVRRHRRERLMRLQQDISLDVHRGWIGRELEVLVESVQGGVGIGRSYRDGPEVDGTVRVAACSARPGEFCTVRIKHADVYDLGGVMTTRPGAVTAAGNGAFGVEGRDRGTRDTLTTTVRPAAGRPSSMEAKL
ncbi:MAG: 30S ribosomal protein S12 methylthiotransferase RimO [Chthonomonadales bacterium]|nr:30S ribosomal protein S12 methylthiotransferase RimO [Chthonomonadales bacterium]